MFLLKLQSFLFHILEKLRYKEIKTLGVTSFNDLAIFPDVSFFKSYEQKMFKKIIPEKLHGKIISMGSCFSEQIGFLLSKDSPNQYMVYEKNETNRFCFNADWGRIYSPVSFLELLRFYNGKEIARMVKIPLSVSSIIKERKFKNYITNNDTLINTNSSFIELYREHLFISENESVLIQHLELHKEKAIRAMREASHVFLTFGTLEYWADSLGNLWPIRPTNLIAQNLKVENKILSFDEFRNVLNECIIEIRQINPEIRIHMFVTPVPLYATFTEASSIERFFYDSSVILLAMRSLESKEEKVSYLPIFESIQIDNPIIRHKDMRHIIDKKVKSVLKNII
jgi:hypothetical protein